MSTVDELASPQFQELSHLAARYRVDLSRFRALRAKLDAADPDTKGVATVNLGAQLAAHDLLQPHRLQRLIAVPVQRDIEDFVRALCRALASTEDPRHASAKVGRHGICEYQVVHTVPELFSTAMIDAILHGGDDVSEITDGVVRALDALWAELCTPLVAAERHSLQADAPAVRKLSAFVLRLVQMLDNGRTAAGIFGVAKAEFTNLRHTIHRVVTDSLVLGLRSPQRAAHRPAHGAHRAARRQRGRRDGIRRVGARTRRAAARCARVRRHAHGGARRDGRVCHRVARAVPARRGERSVHQRARRDATFLWRVQYLDVARLRVADCAQLVRPTARPAHRARALRAAIARRVRHAAARPRLALVRVAADCARDRRARVQVVEPDGRPDGALRRCRAACGRRRPRRVCGTPCPRRRKRGRRRAARGSSSGSSSGAIASAAGALTAVALSTTSASPSVASTVAAAAARSGDFFVRPVAKSKSIPFTPSAVARSSLLEYTVLYSLMSLLENILAERRANMNHGVVGIAMSTVTDEVATMVMTMYRSEGALILKLADGDASSASLNVKMLRKLVVWTVRKVLKCGQDGCAAARRAEAPRAAVHGRGARRPAQRAERVAAHWHRRERPRLLLVLGPLGAPQDPPRRVLAAAGGRGVGRGETAARERGPAQGGGRGSWDRRGRGRDGDRRDVSEVTELLLPLQEFDSERKPVYVH